MATQTVAEHRMYLPLAAVVSLAVCGAHVGLRGKGDRHLLCAAPGGPFRQKVLVPFSWLAGGLTAAVAITFGIMTFDRNVTYQSDLAIWRDTLAKAPANTRARNNLGKALVERGDLDQAMKEFREVIRTKPDDVQASINVGMVLGYRGQLQEAILGCAAVSDKHPEIADAHFRLAVALNDLGQFAEAVGYYRKALAWTRWRSRP